MVKIVCFILYASYHNFFLIFFFNIFYLFLGQSKTEHERGRGRERGRHRIGSRLQALSCQHRADGGDLNPQIARSWPELKSDTRPTEPLRLPKKRTLNYREETDGYQRVGRGEDGWNRWWGLRRALLMGIGCCMEALNHYIVHLKVVLHCILTGI